VPESIIQCIWYDRLFREDELVSHDGRRVKIVFPGWWNRGEGPDFLGAQVEFNGRPFSGDVEIHLHHADWTRHGHHLDERYNEVILVVVLEPDAPVNPPVRASGKRIPTLSLAPYLKEDLGSLAAQVPLEDYPYNAGTAAGKCAVTEAAHGGEAVCNLVRLAGEWRVLRKAHSMRERMDGAGEEQAIYELLLGACGYSHFKHHFLAIARQLHYERARQLARQDPMLLEAAFLQVAGLLPDNLPEGTQAVPHYARLRGLRRDFLPGLKPLPLEWRRVGVRPVNNPERRLAGAAMLIAHTAREGLLESISQIWDMEVSPAVRRRHFEEVFSKYMGFWAVHCTWTGKPLRHPTAPVGNSRIRSIIGNVFVPAGLALARKARDFQFEERVLAFFHAMPPEPDNKITRMMTPRLYGSGKPPKLDFCLQQGMIQIRQDWCESNPSCRNCSILSFINQSNSAIQSERL
jgi:hypothetical protein